MNNQRVFLVQEEDFLIIFIIVNVGDIFRIKRIASICHSC